VLGLVAQLGAEPGLGAAVGLVGALLRFGQRAAAQGTDVAGGDGLLDGGHPGRVRAQVTADDGEAAAQHRGVHEAGVDQGGADLGGAIGLERAAQRHGPGVGGQGGQQIADLLLAHGHVHGAGQCRGPVVSEPGAARARAPLVHVRSWRARGFRPPGHDHHSACDLLRS
jgi:hypothetical protein